MSQRVLIVDDNPSNGMVAQFMLEELGFESDIAGSGPEALEMLDKLDYGLMLLDWMMPGMDGIQVLNRLKELPQHIELKIILSTAKASKEDQREGLNSGAHAFLTKPLTIHSLQNGLRKAGLI